MEEGNIKMHNGIPEIIGVNLEAKDCELIDTWHTIGMQATDSGDVSVNDVVVPLHLTFPLAPEFQANEYFRGTLYNTQQLAPALPVL
jgi:hypothetical protein